MALRDAVKLQLADTPWGCLVDNIADAETNESGADRSQN